MKFIKRFNESTNNEIDFEELFLNIIDLGYKYTIFEKNIRFDVKSNDILKVSNLNSNRSYLQDEMEKVTKLESFFKELLHSLESLELLGYKLKVISNSNYIDIHIQDEVLVDDTLTLKGNQISIDINQLSSKIETLYKVEIDNIYVESNFLVISLMYVVDGPKMANIIHDIFEEYKLEHVIGSTAWNIYDVSIEFKNNYKIISI